MANLENFKKSSILTNVQKYSLLDDYLRFSFEKPLFRFERIMSKLNIEGSNFHIEGEFTYQKIPYSMGMGLQISISYNDVAIPIMCYVVFGRVNKIQNKYAKLDFYGSFFRLITVGHINKNFIDDFLKNNTNEDPLITRFDDTIDLFFKDKTILPARKKVFTKINAATKHYEIGKGFDLESRSIGSKSSKRYIVRMYDKLKDIEIKGKFFLYSDYLQYGSVHRLEFQLGPHFCRHFKRSTLHILKQKVENFIGLSPVDFEGLMFYEYEPNFEINDYNRLLFTKQFVGKAIKFLNNDLNFLLILNDYFINLPDCLEKTRYFHYFLELVEKNKIEDIEKYIKKIKGKFVLADEMKI